MSADDIHDLFAKAAAKGQQIRGGCDECDAFQVLTEAAPGVWSLVVHHDDDCSFMRRRKAGSN